MCRWFRADGKNPVPTILCVIACRIGFLCVCETGIEIERAESMRKILEFHYANDEWQGTKIYGCAAEQVDGTYLVTTGTVQQNGEYYRLRIDHVCRNPDIAIQKLRAIPAISNSVTKLTNTDPNDYEIVALRRDDDDAWQATAVEREGNLYIVGFGSMSMADHSTRFDDMVYERRKIVATYNNLDDALAKYKGMYVHPNDTLPDGFWDSYEDTYGDF